MISIKEDGGNGRKIGLEVKLVWRNQDAKKKGGALITIINALKNLNFRDSLVRQTFTLKFLSFTERVNILSEMLLKGKYEVEKLESKFFFSNGWEIYAYISSITNVVPSYIMHVALFMAIIIMRS